MVPSQEVTLFDLVHHSHPNIRKTTSPQSHTTPSLHENKEITPIYRKQPFTRKEYTKKWAKEENRKFFKALKIFGTDFSLIANFFESRSRVQIKVTINNNNIINIAINNTTNNCRTNSGKKRNQIKSK
jgi:hypothetical protein